MKSLGIDENDRTRCSFLCRSIIQRPSVVSDPKEDLKYQYRIYLGRMGTCKTFCKHLLLPEDFKRNNFSYGGLLSSIYESEIYAVRHNPTSRDFIVKKIYLDESDHRKFYKLHEKYRGLVHYSYYELGGYLMPILGVSYDSQEYNNNNLSEIEKENSIDVYMPNYDITLGDYLRKNNFSLDRDDIVSIGYSIAKGLEELHNINNVKMNVAHRQVNIDNVFGFNSNCGTEIPFLWVLGNFREFKAKNINEIINSGNTSYLTAAPEQIIELKSSGKSDIWSLGAILYQLITKKKNPVALHTLFNKPVKYNQIKKEIEHHVLGSMVCDMLKINENDRPSAREIVNGFKKLEKNGKIRIDDCRCSVPFAQKYVTFDKKKAI